MKKLVICLLLLSASHALFAQSEQDRRIILGTLERQSADWNRGDVAAFMKGYLESDSLMFIGKSGVTYGYQATYQNYLRRYPDRAAMGKLKFDIVHLSFPARDVAFLVGKWHLTRPQAGDVGGHFTLTWKKIKGNWVIIADHSS